MKEATILHQGPHLILMVVCVTCVCVYMVTSGVMVWVSIVSGVCGVLVSKYEWGSVGSVGCLP